ncbi:hypothetical protein BIZ83_gp139 [Erwinia phage vB_EamM_ChrisDB]|uniref:hypothetical protein n=1 Tax=Erwinia phage vB_EamM_ChrisDB TaxID=1883371 RepID=UPI00081D2248|nr:hypothetical protein BIZ83_gp139 [Erwinia phage vB_EamM_ChrisDB]ANZ48714.1 hypothetical protein CHRISDB_152 [Erwinia phage vB_EamM_ChrisDB]
MLKPRKCRKALLILSPRLKIAVGKKLYTVNGPWAANQFQLYTTTSMSNAMQGMHKVKPRRMTQQLGMVARKLGTTYKRHMEKVFAPKLTLNMINEMDFTRAKPTEPGGSFPLNRFGWANAGAMNSDAYLDIMKICGTHVTTRPEFNYHDHIPNKDQKHYFATPVAKSGHSVLTSECRTELSRQKESPCASKAMMTIPEAKEGTLLDPELEIKGVHLKQSRLTTDQITTLIGGFGEQEDKDLLARLSAPGAVITPEDDAKLQKVAKQCLFREIEHMG